MTLSRLLKSAAGTCPHCNEKAGILSREHSECRRTFDSGFQEMVNLAADAARSHTFDEKSLRLALAEVARRSYGDGATVNQALEEGWKQGLAHCMADGIMTQAEESRLREFRDRLALEDSGADRKATEELEKAAIDRITFDAPGSPPSPWKIPNTTWPNFPSLSGSPASIKASRPLFW